MDWQRVASIFLDSYASSLLEKVDAFDSVGMQALLEDFQAIKEELGRLGDETL